MSQRKFKKLPISMGYLFLFATLISILFVFQRYSSYLYWGETEAFNWLKFGVPPFVNNYTWLLLLPLVYNTWLVYKLDENSSSASYWLQGLIGFLFSVFHELFSNLVFFVPLVYFGFIDFNCETLNFVIGSTPSAMITRFIEYWIFLGVFMIIDYYKKYRHKQLELAQLENKLTNAQLNALRMQLQPHFLFNALNTVSALMEENIQGAQRVLSKLGYLLRTMLDQKQEHCVPLEQELNYIQSYLDIEQVRFRDRLVVDYQIPDNTLEALVPNLILQPLVENAVKHGFSKRIDSGFIKIKSRKLPSLYLELMIEDDGQGFDNSTHILRKPGIGIRNTQERLNQMYGSDHQFSISSNEPHGTIVKMVIPFQC